MNTLAYEIISDMENAEHAIEIVKLFSTNTGFNGMIGGQISDMYFEEDIDRLSYTDLIHLHNSKTGKLIKASVLSGIILAGKSYKTDEFLRF
jgi:geranylgeranyl diphosphate synthase type II